jgi:LysM repeat protein
MERGAIVVVAGMLLCSGVSVLEAQTLRGSPRAMQKQNRVAVEHDYTFLQTSAQVRRFVDMGLLVHLPGNADYALARVSHPYARPAVKLFVERLASQYRAACGEKLVVTSLTRPVREQPRNASHLSVHPAGMAVDLRISGRSACRSWLERTLMALERQGVLDAIRENRPPHYHVALFPEPYTRYVARLTGGAAQPQVAVAPKEPAPRAEPAVLATANLAPGPETAGPSGVDDGAAAGPAAAAERIAIGLESSPDALTSYRVNRGDSLWSIARRHGTTVDTLKRLNGLRNTAILAGQTLSVPAPADVSGAEDARP